MRRPGGEGMKFMSSSEDKLIYKQGYYIPHYLACNATFSEIFRSASSSRNCSCEKMDKKVSNSNKVAI